MMVEVVPQKGAGAEVRGVDLGSLSDEEFAEVERAFADYGVIFFRDQSLTEDQHIEFAERFGSINVNRFFAKHPDFDKIALVVKEPADALNIGGTWHADHSYDAEPALGSILVARELPPAGGDTLFASMYAAYESLDDELREFVDTHSAMHSGKHVFATGGFYDKQVVPDFAGRIGNTDSGDALVDTVHPMVISHPLSGKRALFVNPSFTIGIEGMDEADAKPILQRLYAHTLDGDHICRFVWEPGSVAFWDNRSVWHNAMNDYEGHRREMHRITLDGCTLSGAS
jgi:taurine dioxygenase